MQIVNIHEAKTQFSRLLSRVHAGEEIIIAKAGESGTMKDESIWCDMLRIHRKGYAGCAYRLIRPTNKSF
jgi:hypothetical protein